MKIRNEEISKAHADEAQARAEAMAHRHKAERLEFSKAHAEGLHDEVPREFCPDCEESR